MPTRLGQINFLRNNNMAFGKVFVLHDPGRSAAPDTQTVFADGLKEPFGIGTAVLLSGYQAGLRLLPERTANQRADSVSDRVPSRPQGEPKHAE
jgi:hypothetical protein